MAVAFTEGVEEHIEDIVTGVAKTVADCLNYRNQIGLEVALEGLREAWHEKHMTSDGIWSYAKVCRITKVMRPDLGSLTLCVRNIGASVLLRWAMKIPIVEDAGLEGGNLVGQVSG